MITRTISGFALIVSALHLAGCSRSTGARTGEPKPEPATLNVTHWTDRTELYLEHPPLVAAQSIRFAVHLTTLNDFHALAAGVPSLEFTPEQGGAPVVLHGTPPSRPGAFRIEGAPPAAGRYRWALLVDAPGVARSVREAPEIDGIVEVPRVLAAGTFHKVVVTGARGPDLVAEVAA